MALDTTITERSLADIAVPGINQVYVPLATGANALITLTAAKQIQITKMILSTGTTGVFTLNSGSDVVAIFNMLANSPLPLDAGDGVVLAGSAGANLNMVVTGAAANAGIYLQYKIK